MRTRFGIELDQLREVVGDGGTDERAEDRLAPPDHDDQDQRDRLVDTEAVDVDVRQVVGVERARRAGEDAADGEGEDLQPRRGDADRTGQLLVLPDRGEVLAEPRSAQPHHAERHDRDGGEAQVVHRDPAGEAEPEELDRLRHRDAAAAGAGRDLPVVGGDGDGLGDDERDDHEVVTLRAQDGHRHQRAGHERSDHREQQVGDEPPVPVLDGEGGAERSDPPRRHHGDGHLTGEGVGHEQPVRGHRPDQADHRQVDVPVGEPDVGQQRQQRHHDDDGQVGPPPRGSGRTVARARVRHGRPPLP